MSLIKEKQRQLYKQKLVIRISAMQNMLKKFFKMERYNTRCKIKLQEGNEKQKSNGK